MFRWARQGAHTPLRLPAQFCALPSTSISDTIPYRLQHDITQTVREELSALRIHVSDVRRLEMETLESRLKADHEEKQLQIKQHFEAKTKSLQDNLAKISLENQALQGQLAEVLQLLRANPTPDVKRHWGNLEEM